MQSKPDYTNSIVNLMSSVYAACGWADSPYPRLPACEALDLAAANNIVLLVIDGLGKRFLDNAGGTGLLARNCRHTLTSVFPSTTSAALTSYATGLAPQQHAVTGWFMYLAETGCVSAILPFKPRVGGSVFSDMGVTMQDVLQLNPMFPKLQRDVFVVNHQHIIESDFSRLTTAGATRIPFQRFSDCLSGIESAVRRHAQPKYIYAYWAEFDGLCHIYGTASEKVGNHFQELQTDILRFLDSIADTNTVVLISADHGFVDTAPNRVIYLDKHPVLQNCLAMPLSGEPRTAYCYVRNKRDKSFEHYLEAELSSYLWWAPSEQMVELGYFGSGEVNPKLYNRIGDYVLMMKDNYVIKDTIAGEGPFSQIGVHGGVASDEMEIPLVVLRP